MNPINLKIQRLDSLKDAESSYEIAGKKLSSVSISRKEDIEFKNAFEILPNHSPALMVIEPGSILRIKYIDDGGKEFAYSKVEEITIQNEGLVVIKPSENVTNIFVKLFFNGINPEL